MSKKRIIFSLIIGVIVMGISPILGAMLFTHLFSPQLTLPIVLSRLLLYAFFIPGGLVSGLLIKKKGWLMGGITACIFIAGIILIAQIHNNLPSTDNMPSHYVPPQPVTFALVWQDFVDSMQYIPGILVAGVVGGFLGELTAKKNSRAT
jgi:putative membrane protein (TIGR04086 family)